MELTVSPVTILCRDGCKRPILDMHLSHGFLQLKGVKVLMCGLYSGVGKLQGLNVLMGGLYSGTGRLKDITSVT